jgi:hypothetical protein
MSSGEMEHETNQREVTFPNGNCAHLVQASPLTPAARVLQMLHLERPAALIMVFGAAASLEPNVELRLEQLFSRGIARAAIDKRAAIVDGGTQSGVMALMGKGVADRGRQTVLLGVAPAGKVTYPDSDNANSSEDHAPLDRNHSHFVLVRGNEWGDETEMMFRLAKSLAEKDDWPSAVDDTRAEEYGNRASTKIPVVTILAGGRLDGIAKKEALNSVRHGWPLILIEGSGELPDEISRLYRDKHRAESRKRTRRWRAWYRLSGAWVKRRPLTADTALAEIAEEGNLYFIPLESDAVALRSLVNQQLPLSTEENVLEQAWQRFALYDANAKRHQRLYRQLRNWPLALGVITTILAITFTVVTGWGWLAEGSYEGLAARAVIILLPILTSALLAAEVRFKSGSKYILLRFSAEAIKQAIYRYRVLAGLMLPHSEDEVTPGAQLAQHVEDINSRLMATDVSEAALRPYEGPVPPAMDGAIAPDDGYSHLTPDRYLSVRIGDQVSFYRDKTNRIEKQLRWLQALILFSGGAGAFLAAMGAELWIPVATAMVIAITSYLGFHQLEETLKKYNQAEANLSSLRAWWAALSPEQKKDAGNIEKLVTHTERVLATELSGWVQEMQNALAGLRQPDIDEGTSPEAPAADTRPQPG